MSIKRLGIILGTIGAGIIALFFALSFTFISIAQIADLLLQRKLIFSLILLIHSLLLLFVVIWPANVLFRDKITRLTLFLITFLVINILEVVLYFMLTTTGKAPTSLLVLIIPPAYLLYGIGLLLKKRAYTGHAYFILSISIASLFNNILVYSIVYRNLYLTLAIFGMSATALLSLIIFKKNISHEEMKRKFSLLTLIFSLISALLIILFAIKPYAEYVGPLLYMLLVIFALLAYQSLLSVFASYNYQKLNSLLLIWANFGALLAMLSIVSAPMPGLVLLILPLVFLIMVGVFTVGVVDRVENSPR